MANHHDNFDIFDSTYQPWNSVNVGPKKDIVGGWMKAAREAGLALRAFPATATAPGAGIRRRKAPTPTGPLAGVPYDGLMTKADGKGLWWEGLDPQDYYAQYHTVGQIQLARRRAIRRSTRTFAKNISTASST